MICRGAIFQGVVRISFGLETQKEDADAVVAVLRGNGNSSNSSARPRDTLLRTAWLKTRQWSRERSRMGYPMN